MRSLPSSSSTRENRQSCLQASSSFLHLRASAARIFRSSEQGLNMRQRALSSFRPAGRHRNPGNRLFPDASSRSPQRRRPSPDICGSTIPIANAAATAASIAFPPPGAQHLDARLAGQQIRRCHHSVLCLDPLPLFGRRGREPGLARPLFLPADADGTLPAFELPPGSGFRDRRENSTDSPGK